MFVSNLSIQLQLHNEVILGLSQNSQAWMCTKNGMIIGISTRKALKNLAFLGIAIYCCIGMVTPNVLKILNFKSICIEWSVETNILILTF